MPERIVGKEKKALLLKGTLSDLMRVDPDTGEARFIYRKAKHFIEIKEQTFPMKQRPSVTRRGRSPIEKLIYPPLRRRGRGPIEEPIYKRIDFEMVP